MRDYCTSGCNKADQSGNRLESVVYCCGYAKPSLEHTAMGKTSLKQNH